MKILVTGGSGFIGGSIVRALKKENLHVESLIRKGSYGDLRNEESMNYVTKDMDIVINCAAALSHHKLLEKDFWDINVLGLKNLTNACIKNRVKKLIHFSTVAVYGPTSKEGFDERAEVNFQDIYSQTKHEGDKIIRSTSSELPTLIIRPTIAYGPGDLRPVIYRLFRMVKKGVGLTIDRGENYLHTVYLDNIIDAVSLAIGKSFPSGEDIIVGDSYCPKMAEIIEEISKVQKRKYFKLSLPKTPALIAGKLLGMEKTVRFVSENRKYKITKAERILGYKPKVDLFSGLTNTFYWYKKNKFL